MGSRAVWLKKTSGSVAFEDRANAVAAHQALQQQLPARQPDEITALLTHFRNWFRGLGNPASIEEFIDGVLDIAPELFDGSVVGNINDFRRQWMLVVNDLYPLW